MPDCAVRDALLVATDRLRAARIESPVLNAQVLLAHALGVDRLWVTTHSDGLMAAADFDRYMSLVVRRTSHEPLAYVRGTQEFFGLDFEVSPAVLVPRPETELLVELAVDTLKAHSSPTLMDVGTGSGCIAVACAVHLRNARVTAVDRSAAAIEVARRNAERHNVADRITFLVVDYRAAELPRPVEMIVSNPPYISSEEIARLQAEVRDYEPRIALDGGPQGLEYIRLLADRSQSDLAVNGLLAVEVGAGQAADAAALFCAAGLVDIGTVRDLQGIERVVHGTWIGRD